MQQRRDRPQGPPRGAHQLLALGARAGPTRELHQPPDQGVGVGDGQTGLGEAAIAEASCTQRRLHRGGEGRVVFGVHRMQRDAHQRRLDDVAGGERGVEIAGIEPGQSVPQSEIGRGRLLRLQGDHAAHALSHAEPFAA